MLTTAQPGDQVALRYWVTVSLGSSVSLDLAASSSAGLDWTLYRGTAGAPDTSEPIQGPVTLDGTLDFWALADIPSGWPSGEETLVITATEAAGGSRSAYASDTVWIGQWAFPEGWAYLAWLEVASHADGLQGSRWVPT